MNAMKVCRQCPSIDLFICFFYEMRQLVGEPQPTLYCNYFTVMGKSQIKSNRDVNQMTTVPDFVNARNVISVYIWPDCQRLYRDYG